MKNINITAQDIETFQKAEELLKKLPVCILNQIESAKFGGVGLECVIKNQFKDTQTINIPDNTTQIADFGKYIGIYSNEYFFKIIGDVYKKKLQYAFIECENINTKDTKEVVGRMIFALNDRSGFDDWWNNIGKEIQTEITDELSNIVSCFFKEK